MPLQDASPSRYFGKDWPSILDVLQQRILSWSRDNKPPHASYPELTHNGALTPAVDRAILTLYSSAARGQTSFRKHYETKYLHKMGARNVRLASQTRKQFDSITWNWQTVSKLTAQDVVDALSATVQSVPQGMHIHYFNPPKDQASAGLWVDGDRVFTGKKGNIWELAMGRAQEWLKELSSLNLTWRDLDASGDQGRAMGQQLAKKFGWCFVPAWRLDGGANKLRMLLIGHIVMYIIETWFWFHLHHALVDNDHFGYHPTHVKNFFERGIPTGYKYLSGDFQAYDQSQTPEHLRAVYEGVAAFCGLPESVAVVLYLYNCYTPALISKEVEHEGRTYSLATVRMRNGQAASGIGGFAFANTVGCAAANRKTAKYLKREWIPGTYMGDDHVQPIDVGVALWCRTMREVCGLSMDRKDTLSSTEEAIYCRRFFRKGTRESLPVVMSRARNVIYPEYPDPWSMHPFRRAIVYRAQGLELMIGHQLNAEGRAAWEILAPYEHHLYELFPESNELAAAYAGLTSIGWVVSEDAEDNLTRAIAWMEP